MGSCTYYLFLEKELKKVNCFMLKYDYQFRSQHSISHPLLLDEYNLCIIRNVGIVMMHTLVIIGRMGDGLDDIINIKSIIIH